MANWGKIGAAVFSILNSNSDVFDLYSRRIYPNTARFNTTTYPIIVYTITDTLPTNTKGSSGNSKLDVVEVQLALFHRDYSDMLNGQIYVRAALDYVSEGTYPSSGSNSIQVQSCTIQRMNQDYIEDFDEQGLYVSYIDFKFRQKLD